jgi:beta-glucosidase
MNKLWNIRCVLVAVATLCLIFGAFSDHAVATSGGRPWMDRSLSADRRAELVVDQMTLDEKLQMVHGTGWGVLRDGSYVPVKSNRGVGYVPGIERLGIPDINMTDSAVGIRRAASESRYATLLPSVLGLAATWD